MSFEEYYDKINLITLIEHFNTYYFQNANVSVESRNYKPLNKKYLLNYLLEGFIIQKEYLSHYNESKKQDTIIREFNKLMNQNHQVSNIANDAFSQELEDKQKKSNETTNINNFRKNVQKLYDELFIIANYALECSSDTKANPFSEDSITKYFESLKDMCREPHFTVQELEYFDSLLMKKDYSIFFTEIWLHAFRCAHYNLPYMYAARAYQEALTLKVHNEMRDELLRLASSQNKVAALDYGIKIFEHKFEEGVHYFLEALPLPAAYWVLAFQLENAWEQCSETLIKEITKNSKVKLAIKHVKENKARVENINGNGNNFLVDVVPIVIDEDQHKCLELALNIYIYLCTTMQFSKAFNSIGKLLLLNKIRIRGEDITALTIDECPKSRETAMLFLNHAIALGNGNAMVNISRYYMERLDSNDKLIQEEAINNIPIIKSRLRFMADMHEVIACEYYADSLLHKQFQNTDSITEENYLEALKYYEYAATHNRPTAAVKLQEAQAKLQQLYQNN